MEEQNIFTFYVCKMCGRGIRAEEHPKFCYYDRMNSIENISDEDAQKMGLNIPLLPDEIGLMLEFPGDLRYNPFTGNELVDYRGLTLSEFQDVLLKEVLCEGPY